MSSKILGNQVLRVLVVDSNEHGAASELLAFAEAPGVKFRLASDRASALEIAAAFQPQVAVFDLSLPRLEGFHLARQFRQSDLLRQVWLVAGSLFGDAAYRTLAKDAGFDDFVMKPYTPSRIQGLFEKALNSSAVLSSPSAQQPGLLGERFDPAHLLTESPQHHGSHAPTPD